MTRTIIVPSADGSASGLPPVEVSTFAREIGRIPGLIHLVDPETISVPLGTAINGYPAYSLNDRVRGRPIRTAPSGGPVLFNDPATMNGKTLFDLGQIAECNLAAQESSYTPSLTFLAAINVNNNHTIDGTQICYILRALEDGSVPRLGFLVSGTSVVLRDETANAGLQWTFGGILQFAKPAVIGFTIDQPSNTWRIFFNDPNNDRAHATVATSAYPAARFNFFGAGFASASFRSHVGRTAIWNRALTNVEMQNAMGALRDYYAIVS